MKIVGIILIVCTLLFACDKSKKKTGTVTRDCTGTYVTIIDKDYRVCNLEVLSNYEIGSSVLIEYTEISECQIQDSLIVCAMYHENEGWIEITDVK
ncbi:MAG: hypothetical protein ACPGU5_00750 [Lishizhenia sp.]